MMTNPVILPAAVSGIKREAKDRRDARLGLIEKNIRD